MNTLSRNPFFGGSNCKGKICLSLEQAKVSRCKSTLVSIAKRVSYFKTLRRKTLSSDANDKIRVLLSLTR